MPLRLFKYPLSDVSSTLKKKKKIAVKELKSSSSVPRSTLKLADGNTIAIVQHDYSRDTHTQQQLVIGFLITDRERPIDFVYC